MNNIFQFFLLACIVISCSTELNSNLPISVEGKYKILNQDSIVFADEKFNDEGWAEIEQGKSLESVFPDYDGVVWYRKSIVVPEKLKSLSEKAYGYVNINLGYIDDADETYFNGIKIGQTGNLLKKVGNDYSKPRIYQIPDSLIHWGAENLLAVRVVDHGQSGGITRGRLSLNVSGAYDLVKISYKTHGDEGVFINTPPSYRFYLKNNMATGVSGLITTKVTTDQYEEISYAQESVNIEAGGFKDFDYTYTKELKPGIYLAYITINIDGKEGSLSDSLYFAYNPQLIDAGLSQPDDFEEYWKNALAELAMVAPNYQLVPSEEYSTDIVDVYELQMYSLGNVRVGGWYSVPKEIGDAKLPALVRHIGYSGNNMPIVDRPQFACLSFNTRGHGNSKKDVDPGFPQYITTNLDSPENYIYKGAYMDCVRAIDFLCSRKEVDTSRIAVYGGSQGGALSIANTALDSRIDLCAPHVPFLSDFRNYFEINEFPRKTVEKYLSENPDMTMGKVFETLDYIDIRNLAPWVKVPVYMGAGLRDNICPPYINMAAFNNIASEDKQWFIYEFEMHSVTNEHHKAELEWIKSRFNVSE